MTVHSGEERTIWEGVSQNVTAMASGGRFTLHYRLTTHYLYFETGGVTGTKQEQVPLIAIQDVDISQNMVQKARKVGTLLVHIVRPGAQYRETATLDSVPDPAMVRDTINRTVHAVRVSAHQRQVGEQRDLNTHRFEGPGRAGVPGNGVPPAITALPMSPTAIPQQSAPATAGMDAQQIMSVLKQLGELRDAGVITLEEFETKKAEMLGRL